MNIKRFSVLVLCSFIICEMAFISGCASFTKKFTRKKKVVEQEEVMVLIPEEYKKDYGSNKDLYRDYYIVWRSWHGELEDSLTPGANPKKQSECIKYVIENLSNMKDLLIQEKQADLEVSINSLNQIKSEINKPYINSLQLSSLRDSVSLIKKDIQKKFSYSKISKWIK